MKLEASARARLAALLFPLGALALLSPISACSDDSTPGDAGGGGDIGIDGVSPGDGEGDPGQPGDGGPGDGGPGDGGPGDGEGGDDGGGPGDGGPEDAGEGDALVDPCVDDPGANGCPCESNAECNSDYCVPSASGTDICTGNCESAASCEDGQECEFVSLPGQDPTFLCVETGINLCRPCNANADCPGLGDEGDARCIDWGDEAGGFCGLACDVDADCPDSYSCLEVPDKETGALSLQCYPDAGACTCNGLAIAEAASTVCTKGGVCEGTRVCTVDGLSECDAPVPSTEICDGADNNCNGVIDEGFVNTDGDELADCIDPDDDDDTVLDEDDNCPLKANPGQADTDGDGIGDICDAPEIPTIDASEPPSPANENAPVVSGTGEPGSTVQVYDDECFGDVLATALVGDDGTWSAAIEVEDDTTTELWVNAINTEDEISECSAEGLTYVEDSTPPGVPLLLGTDPDSPSTSAEPTLEGSAEAGATLFVYADEGCGGDEVATGEVEADGTFAIPVPAAEDDTTTYYAVAIDEAGNVSDCTETGLEYESDLTAPEPPVFTGTNPPSPSTTGTTPILLGTSEPGTTVTLYSDADCATDPLYEDSANSAGLFSIVVEVEENSVNFYYGTATDDAGNVSECSPIPAVYVHDNIPPVAPLLEGTIPDSPGNTTQPQVFGTSEPLTTVELYFDPGCLGFVAGTSQAELDGTFVVDVIVADNVETFLYGKAIDLVGQESPCSEGISYVHDGVAPGALTFTGTTPASPSSEQVADVEGDAEAGATVDLYATPDCSGDPVGSGEVAEDGTFAVSVTFEENLETTVYGTVTDPAGNTSDCSPEGIGYTHDDIPPPPPEVTGTNPPSPSSSQTPNLLGTSEPDATLTIYTTADCSGDPVGAEAADETGAFAATETNTLPENATSTLYATATDAAGNVSACSTTFATYVHDDTQPTVPVITGTAPASPTNLTTSPNVQGTTDGNATVRIYTTADCSGDPLGEGTSNAAGDFSVPVTVAANSTTTLYAASEDAAGNVSPCTPDGFDFTHDDVEPSQPLITGTSPQSPSSESTTPEVSGTAEPGTTITYHLDPNCLEAAVGSTTVADDGTFAGTATVPANTESVLYAAATDAAGNKSACSAGVAYRHDDSAPAPPVLEATNPASPSNDPAPVLTGTAEAGGTVRLYTTADCSGSVVGTATAAADGTFTLAPLVGLNTDTTLYGNTTDDVGNTSDCAGPLTYTHDDIAPDPPTLDATAPPSPTNLTTTPNVQGTAELGATVEVYTTPDCSGGASGTAVAADGTWDAAITVPVPPNSSNTFYATATDPAGNTSACSPVGIPFVHDATGASAPVLTGTTPASPNNAVLDPAVEGTAEANATLTVYATPDCTGDPVGAGVADDTGAFAAVSTVAANATTTLSATQTDPAGNVSDCSNAIDYTHDDVAPAPPEPLATTPASPSPATDPNVQGTAEASGTVTLYATPDCSDAAIGSGAADADGNFDVAVTVPADATTAIYGTTTDAAGNVSGCSPTSVTYTNDGTAPDPPVFTGTTPASPSNASNTPSVEGTAEAGGSVTLYTTDDCSGGAVGSGAVAGDGTFAIVVTEAVADDSTVTWYGTATDAGGNTSVCSPTGQPYTYDLTAPAPPTITGSTPATPNNSSTEPSIDGDAGAAEGGATISLHATPDCSDAPVASGTAAADGTFGVTLSVNANETTTIYATTTDLAGNTSGCSAGFDYTHDDVPPAAPATTGTNPASPASSLTPNLLGTAEPGATITVYDDDTCTNAIGTGSADGAGDFAASATVPANATTQLYATATDAAGNVSACSTPAIAYTHDDTEPTIPNIEGSIPNSPSNATTNPDLVGVSDAGDTVRIYTTPDCSGAPVAETTANAGGTFQVAVSVPDNGSETFYAASEDAAGNVSPCSPFGYTYVHDTIAPDAPVVSGTTPASPSATVLDPSVDGTAEADATVNVYPTADCSGPAAGTGTATGGAFAVSVSVLADSTTTFYASATDLAGNTSACSPTSATYVHDGGAPDPPVMQATNPVSPSNDPTPDVSGTAEPGSTVTLYSTADCSGSAKGSGTAAGDGTFSVQYAATANATNTVYGTATDEAGNVSACSPTFATYVHDDTAPGAPVLTETQPASPSNAASTPGVLGTAEGESTVTLYTAADCSGATSGTTTANPDGSFVVVVMPGVAENTPTTFYATSTDAAGNVSDCSAGIVYEYDTAPPSPPLLVDTDPSTISNSELTPNVIATTEPGATVELFENPGCGGPPVAAGVADGAGDVIIVDVAAGANDTTTWYGQATDVAGNTSSCSPGLSYIHDDIAPDPPTVDSSAPASPASDLTPDISGTAEANATINLYGDPACGGQFLGSGAAGAGGSYTVTATLSPNTTNEVYATATDAAGNVSACSPVPLVYVHDSSAPTTPLLTGTTPASPSNTSTTPTVEGSADADATIDLYTTSDCSGAPVASGAADGAGAFSVGVTVGANTTTTFYATATDAASNTSDCSPGLAYTHDDVPPDAPVLVATTPPSPSNTVTVPDLSGTAEANATVNVYLGDCTGPLIGTGSADGGGDFTISVTVPTNTLSDLVADATDAAGNTGACSAVLQYEHDSNNPNVPILIDTTPDPPSPDQTPLVNGTAEPGSTILFYGGDPNCLPGSQLAGSGAADGAGDFSVEVTVPANATTDIYAVSVDAAGNPSACSGTFVTYEHDDIPPDPPLLGGTIPDTHERFDTQPDVFGNAEPDSDVVLYEGSCSGPVLASGTADPGTGDFTYEITVPENSSTDIYGTATDAAGNTSGCAGPLNFIHDNIPPTFAGAEAVQIVAPGEVEVSWSPGTDNFTPQNQLVYEIMISTQCAFDPTEVEWAPDFVLPASAGPNFSQVFSGLQEDVRYHFLVRARDLATNLDLNTSHVSIKIPGTRMAIDLVVGEQANCLFQSTGEMSCWGGAVPLVDNPKDLALRQDHSCAVNTDTTVSCWGNNVFGQLGNNSVIPSATPVPVSGLSGVAEVAVGVTHSCARRTDGTIWCWGANQFGQLADDTGTLQRNTPVQVLYQDDSPVEGALHIAAGFNHTCAALANGETWCWGFNFAGQLGDNTQGLSAVPVQAQAPVAMLQMAGGEGHTCGVGVDGEVYCWGFNSTGQLGTGDNQNKLVPTAIGLSDARSVGAGGLHTCAVLADGTARCFGNNEEGQLGDGNSGAGVFSNTPLQIATTDRFVAIDGGANHSCGFRADGTVYCWGTNENGELGDGSGAPSAVPVPVTQLQGVSSLSAIDLDTTHACARLSDGSLRCWGSNGAGELGGGYITTPPEAGAVTVVSTLDDALGAVTGGAHSCAIDYDGVLYCFGDDSLGQLGNGGGGSSDVPDGVTVIGTTRQVDLGAGHSCAVLTSGELYCWGDNQFGQLGDGTQNPSDAPVLVASVTDVRQVTVGVGHTCALLDEGTVACWGDDSAGQAGQGGAGSVTSPALVAGLTGIAEVSAGAQHTCALVANGTITCWGAGGAGQLGGGDNQPSLTPQAIGSVTDFEHVTAGHSHTCGLTSNRDAYCWGSNATGELGLGNTNPANTPQLLGSLSEVRAISAGLTSTCAVLVDGTPRCWGNNPNGELNTIDESAVITLPTEVQCLP